VQLGSVYTLLNRNVGVGLNGICVPFTTIFCSVFNSRFALVFVFAHSVNVGHVDTFFSILKKYFFPVGNSLLYAFFVFDTVVSKLYAAKSVYDSGSNTAGYSLSAFRFVAVFLNCM